VLRWGISQKEISKFSCTSDSQETCYFLVDDVIVTPDGGQPVKMGKVI
jgi:uncharacterized protein